MTEASNIRKYLEVLNERAPDVPYQGKVDSPEVSYDTESKGNEINKVIARLKGNWSGKYTKLGRNLLRIERITARIDTLKEEVKQDTRGIIADLFNADDACRTRVVDTVNFIFKITADPKAAETYKYKEILEELETHLTPDLQAKLMEIMEKYKSVQKPKPPSIRLAKDKAEESIEEGAADWWKSVKSSCRKFFSSMLSWGADYDARLDRLKAEIHMTEAGAEPHATIDSHRGHADVKWGALLGLGLSKAKKDKEKKAYKQHLQRRHNKDFISRYADESLEESNPLRESNEGELYRGYYIEYIGHGVWSYYHHDLDGATDSTDSRYGTAKSEEEARANINDDIEEIENILLDKIEQAQAAGQPTEHLEAQLKQLHMESGVTEGDDHDDDEEGLDVGTGRWEDDGMSVQWVEDELDEDGDWYSQDDFQDYNDAEADDYRHEGDEDEADEGEDPETEVVHSLALLGLHPASMSSKSKQQMLALISELDSFAHLVSAHWSEGDQAVNYYCEDPGSVNQGVKLATAWIDENGDFYFEA